MERLKSWFLSIYLMLATVACFHLLIRLAQHWRIELFGALLACAALPVFFLWLAVTRPARTSAHLFGVTALTWLGACLAVFGTLTSRAPLWWPVLYALPLGLGGFLLYLLWYSRLDRRAGILQRLAPIPAITLYDMAGRAVTSDSLTGQPVIWLFFRGSWCPLCVAQVEEMAALYRELESRGIRVVLASPQPLEKTRALAHRLDVPLELLQDRNGQAARALGITHRYGVPLGLGLFGYGRHTAMPTVVVTDAEGDVIFVDQTDNYRVRPEPQTFLKVLERDRARR